MNLIKLTVSGVFLLFLTVACSTNPYRYVPATNQATDPKQAIYPLSDGSVRVQYAGIQDYEVQKDQPKIKVLHLRLLTSNSSSEGVWKVDTSQFFVAFSNGQRAQVLAANPANLEVRPGELRGTDLLFALPEGLKSAEDFGEFDFHWEVQGVHHNYAQTTAFDRVKIEQYVANSPYYPYYGGGMGVAWTRVY